MTRPSGTTRGPGSIPDRPARHPAIHAVLATILIASLAGCGGDDPGTRGDGTSMTTQSSTPGGTGGPSATDPAAVLEAYGLALPTAAQDGAVQEKPHDVFTEQYLVTFTAPAADVESLCADAGLPSTPAVALRADEVAVFGADAPPSGARICRGSDPSDPTRQRAVLFVGDPAQVWVMTWRMPAR